MKRGSRQDLKLSEARAYEVRKYIVDNYNLDDTRIKTKGLGKQEVSGARPEDAVEVLVYLSVPEKPAPAKNNGGESTLPELSNSGSSPAKP